VLAEQVGFEPDNRDVEWITPVVGTMKKHCSIFPGPSR